MALSVVLSSCGTSNHNETLPKLLKGESLEVDYKLGQQTVWGKERLKMQHEIAAKNFEAHAHGSQKGINLRATFLGSQLEGGNTVLRFRLTDQFPVVDKEMLMSIPTIDSKTGKTIFVEEEKSVYPFVRLPNHQVSLVVPGAVPVLFIPGEDLGLSVNLSGKIVGVYLDIYGWAVNLPEFDESSLKAVGVWEGAAHYIHTNLDGNGGFEITPVDYSEKPRIFQRRGAGRAPVWQADSVSDILLFRNGHYYWLGYGKGPGGTNLGWLTKKAKIVTKDEEL